MTRHLTKRKVSSFISRCFMIAFLIGIAYLLLFPFIKMLLLAFRPLPDATKADIKWISSGFTFFNFRVVYDLLTKDSYGFASHPMLNSIWVTLVATVLQTVIAAVTGYGLARFKLKTSGLLLGCVCFTIFLAPQTVFMAMFLNFKEFTMFGIGNLIGLFTGEKWTVNLVGNPIGYFLMILFGQGLRSGLYILIFRQFFKQIPKELEEAAYLDGYGTFSVFLKIMLPNVTVAIVTTLLFSFVFYYNDQFYSNYFLSNIPMMPAQTTTMINNIRSVFKDPNSMKRFSRQLYDLVGEFSYDSKFGDILAQCACLVVISLPVGLYLVLQKYLVGNLVASGMVE